MKNTIKNKPLVSIIIPTYNRANLLPETLDSVLSQKYKNWECILVDDGSTDDTINVIKEYAEKDYRFMSYCRLEQYKKGPAGAFNYGLDLSNGEFIQWFGSDDLMHAEMLSEKVKIFVENPNVQSVFSQLYFFEKRNVITGKTRFRKPYKYFYENAITWNIPVWSLNFMFRTQFLKSINVRFDESLKRLIDYDFHSRIFIKYPHDVYLLDKPLCYVRRNNKGSITTSFFSKERIIDLQKSEYIVANKIIRLLINENKFSKNLEKFYYRDHKKRISNLARTTDRKIIDYFRSLTEFFLTHNKKYFKLTKFRLGFSLLKTMPVDNLFLIYRRPKLFVFINKSVKRLYKILFKKGYLKEKLAEHKEGKTMKQNII